MSNVSEGRPRKTKLLRFTYCLCMSVSVSQSVSQSRNKFRSYMYVLGPLQHHPRFLLQETSILHSYVLCHWRLSISIALLSTCPCSTVHLPFSLLLSLSHQSQSAVLRNPNQTRPESGQGIPVFFSFPRLGIYVKLITMCTYNKLLNSTSILFSMKPLLHHLPSIHNLPRFLTTWFHPISIARICDTYSHSPHLPPIIANNNS